jgi:hypothetical protein
MDFLSGHILKQFENFESTDFSVKLVDDITQTEVMSINLHKLLLHRCNYFSAYFIPERKWNKSDSITISIPDILWITKKAARLFFKLFYSNDYSEIWHHDSYMCLQIHRLADFFCCDDIKRICSQSIIDKMGRDNIVNIITSYSNTYYCDDNIDKACKQWNCLDYIKTEKKSGIMFISEMKKNYEFISASKNFILLEKEWKVQVKFFSDKAILYIIQEKTLFEAMYYLNINVTIIDRYETFVKSMYVNTPYNGSRLDLVHISDEIISHSFETVNNKNETIYSLGFIIDIELKHIVYPLDSHFPHPHGK